MVVIKATSDNLRKAQKSDSKLNTFFRKNVGIDAFFIVRTKTFKWFQINVLLIVIR